MHLVKFSINGQLLTWKNQQDDMAKSMGVGQWATGTGGNKDQLWFSPKKKKTSCTVANGGVHQKKKLNGGYNA